MNGSNKKRKRLFNWDDVYQSSSEDEKKAIKKKVTSYFLFFMEIEYQNLLQQSCKETNYFDGVFVSALRG